MWDIWDCEALSIQWTSMRSKEKKKQQYIEKVKEAIKKEERMRSVT